MRKFVTPFVLLAIGGICSPLVAQVGNPGTVVPESGGYEPTSTPTAQSERAQKLRELYQLMGDYARKETQATNTVASHEGDEKQQLAAQINKAEANVAALDQLWTTAQRIDDLAAGLGTFRPENSQVKRLEKQRASMLQRRETWRQRLDELENRRELKVVIANDTHETSAAASSKQVSSDFLADAATTQGQADSAGDFLAEAGQQAANGGDFLAGIGSQASAQGDWLASAANEELDRRRKEDEERARLAQLERDRLARLARERDIEESQKSYSSGEFANVRQRNRPARYRSSDGYNYRAVVWFFCINNFANGDYSATFSELGTWKTWRESRESIEKKLDRELGSIFRIREDTGRYNSNRFSNNAPRLRSADCNFSFEYGPEQDIDYLYDEAARKLENRIKDFRYANKQVFMTDSVSGDMGTLR